MPYTDYSEVKQTAKGPSLLDRFVNSLKESVPQFEAMFREGVKDIRQQTMEVFLNHREHSPEAGAPMNYTQHMVNEEIEQAGHHGVHGPASPETNYPETAAFEAEAQQFYRSYPDHDRER